MSRFPVAFRPPAFASWSSCSRRGIRPSSRSAYQPHRGPDPDGVTAFRTHELRPGWVPSIPRGRRCSPRTGDRARPASAASQRHVPVPRTNSICRGSASRGINEGSSNSPVRSSPRPPPPGWNEQQLRLSPELRTPPGQEPDDARRGGDRPSSTDLKQRSTSSTEPPIALFTRGVRPRVAPIKPTLCRSLRGWGGWPWVPAMWRRDLSAVTQMGGCGTCGCRSECRHR